MISLNKEFSIIERNLEENLNFLRDFKPATDFVETGSIPKDNTRNKNTLWINHKNVVLKLVRLFSLNSFYFSNSLLVLVL